MFSAFVNSFKVKELRGRILFTAGLIIICRIAASIPCPGVDPANLASYFDHMASDSASGAFMDMFNIFSGGALQKFAIGTLGIMPYISASIIMQLLVPVLPSLERLSREGEVGRNRINQYTRYLTVLICIIQGAMAAVAMISPEKLFLPTPDPNHPLVINPGPAFIAMTTVILTCGTMVLVWLGERITERGIGNGVSLIIAVNIIDRLPQSLVSLYEIAMSGSTSSGMRFRPVHLLILFIVFAVVTALTVLLTQGQRRISIQMAKRVVGNKMMGGNTYIPLKVNFPGVMPIIFAGAILMLPSVLFRAVPFLRGLDPYFQHDSYSYVFIYGLLIMLFSYFWVANMFNPVQVADNLKKEGAYIPGIRPGKPTAEFLDNTMTRVTFAGALFLTGLAVFPTLLYKWFHIPYGIGSFFGGTSLLIIVGVALDTLSQMESMLTMRNYDGFLQKGRLKGRR